MLFLYPSPNQTFNRSPSDTGCITVTLFSCHLSSAAYLWTHLEAWADWRICSVYCPCPVPSSYLTPHSTISLPTSLDVVAQPLSEIQGWDSHCQWNATHAAPWWRRGFTCSVYRYVLSAWNSAWLVESLQIIKLKKVVTIKICSPSGILGPLPHWSVFFLFSWIMHLGLWDLPSKGHFPSHTSFLWLYGPVREPRNLLVKEWSSISISDSDIFTLRQSSRFHFSDQFLKLFFSN